MNKIIFYTFLLVGVCFSESVFAGDVKKVKQTFTLGEKIRFVHLGEPLPGIPYQIIMADGTTIEGLSDEKGELVNISGNKEKPITLNVLEEYMRGSGEAEDKKRFFVILDKKGEPIPNAHYKITMANGFMVEGFADEDGETVSIYTDKPEFLTIKSDSKSTRPVKKREFYPDASCELNTLGPLLNRTKYRDYKLSNRSNKSYTEEKITFANHVKLTVETGACIESSVTTFSFIVPKEMLNKKSPKENLIWLRTQLNSLAWRKDSSPPLEEIDLIIKLFNEMKPFTYGKFQQVEICRNGRIPGYQNDCPWDSGGGTKYEWRENDVYVYLVLTDVRSA